ALVRAAFISTLIPCHDTFHFAGDDKFFVCWDYEHFHARVRGADVGFSGAGRVVPVPVQYDAELVEIRADRLAQFGAVLADAGGENDRIGAVELEKVTTDPSARLADEHVDRELRPGIALRGGFLT